MIIIVHGLEPSDVEDTKRKICETLKLLKKRRIRSFCSEQGHATTHNLVTGGQKHEPFAILIHNDPIQCRYIAKRLSKALDMYVEPQVSVR